GDVSGDADFGSPIQVEAQLSREITDAVYGPNGMYAMLCESAKSEQDGVGVNYIAHLIGKLPNGTYRLKEGADNKKIRAIYQNLKQRYTSQDLDMTDANERIIANWFGSMDETQGEAGMLRVLDDLKTFQRLKKEAGFDPEKIFKRDNSTIWSSPKTAVSVLTPLGMGIIRPL